MDYRHHATDVIAGAIIGIATGWWGYRQYYPSLTSRKSWKPYSPRIPRDDGIPLHSSAGDVENSPLREQRREASNSSAAATYPPNYHSPVVNHNGQVLSDSDYDATHKPSVPMPAFTGNGI